MSPHAETRTYRASKRALPGSAPTQVFPCCKHNFSSACELCEAVPCTDPRTPQSREHTETCPQLSSACRGGALLLLYLCSLGVLWASARHSINYPPEFQRLCLASSLFSVCREVVGRGYGCELELFACFLFIIQRGKSK